MRGFARQTLVFVCVFSLGCQHWLENPDEVDSGVPPNVMKPIDIVDVEVPGGTEDPGGPEDSTVNCQEFDEDLGVCLDEPDPKPESTPVVEIDPNTDELPPVAPEDPIIPPVEDGNVVATTEEKKELEQTLVETPAPVSDPVAESRATPEPISAPGSFQKLARACDVLSDPSESGAVMNPLTAGRRLWTEEVDGRFVKVYRSTGVGYLSVECFREPPVVISEFRAEREERKESPVQTEPVPLPAPVPAPAVEPPPVPVVEEKPQPVAAATVEPTSLPPERPMPPPMVESPEEETVSPLVLGGGAGMVLFALFYWLTGRRQRRAFEQTGSRTLTAL